MKILVHDINLERRQFKNGNYCFEQKAYIHFDGDMYPKELKLTLWPDRETGEEPKPYPKGEYDLDEKSFSMGRYADLICRPVLKPLKSA